MYVYIICIYILIIIYYIQLPLLAESGIDVSAMWKKTLSSPDVQLLEVLCCMDYNFLHAFYL